MNVRSWLGGKLSVRVVDGHGTCLAFGKYWISIRHACTRLYTIEKNITALAATKNVGLQAPKASYKEYTLVSKVPKGGANATPDHANKGA